MNQKTLIGRLESVMPSDVTTNEQIAHAINRLVDAVNQLLPGRGSVVITEDGRLALKNGVPVSSTRDPNVSTE